VQSSDLGWEGRRPLIPTARPWRALLESREFTIFAFLLALSVALSLRYPQFRTQPNLADVLLNVSQLAIVGIGMTMVILTAGIDVSVGSALGVCAVVVGDLLIGTHAAVVAVVGGVMAGVVIGLTNGLLVALGRVHSIIITLAMLNILRLVGFALLHGNWLTGIPSDLSALGNGTVLGVPIAWWLAMGLGGLATYFLRSRPSGRHLYAIGGDVEAARLAGVRVTRLTVFVYALTGALAGLAAAVFVGQQGQVQTNAGSGFELQVIAAVVIGGTSILGGKGSVVGTVLGALLVGVIRNALVVAHVPALFEGLVLGALIIVAIGLDLLHRRRGH
jgi:ribose transport system permease protein